MFTVFKLFTIKSVYTIFVVFTVFKLFTIQSVYTIVLVFTIFKLFSFISRYLNIYSMYYISNIRGIYERNSDFDIYTSRSIYGI